MSLAELGGADGFEPEFAPAADRRGAADLPRRRPAERELGWKAATSLEDGLRLTLDAI